MRGSRPLAALERGLAETVAIRPGEVLVAATSGGPDSAALAALLARAARPAAATLVLAHVNHALRPTAWQDEGVTLALGALLGVRVVTLSLDTEDEAGARDEASLRERRYAALVRIAGSVGAGRVCTAHHAEDQTETVLLALFRGAGPAGLGGMRAARPLTSDVELLRPLLGVEPLALRAYCAAERLPFAVDPTNVDRSYRRNAVRASLATLRESFPHLDAAVARCATILRADRDGEARAILRGHLRAELAAAHGDARDVTFERLDSAARALERGTPGRHFVRRGVELVVE